MEAFELALRESEEVERCKGYYHPRHQFDVYGHTIQFVKHLKALASGNLDNNIVAAGYLHDIGKPVVAKPRRKKGKEGVIIKVDNKIHHLAVSDEEVTDELRQQFNICFHYDDHEKVGEQMVLDMDPNRFTRFSLHQERIAALVGCHYIPMKGILAMRDAAIGKHHPNEDEDQRFQRFGDEYEKLRDQLVLAASPQEGKVAVSVEEILLMFTADKLAQGTGCTDKIELLAIRDILLDEIINHMDNQATARSLDEIFELQQKYQKEK